MKSNLAVLEGRGAMMGAEGRKKTNSWNLCRPDLASNRSRVIGMILGQSVSQRKWVQRPIPSIEQGWLWGSKTGTKRLSFWRLQSVLSRGERDSAPACSILGYEEVFPRFVNAYRFGRLLLLSIGLGLCSTNNDLDCVSWLGKLSVLISYPVSIICLQMYVLSSLNLLAIIFKDIRSLPTIKI